MNCFNLCGLRTDWAQNIDFRRRPDFRRFTPSLSRESNPPKKSPTQIETVCTNSLRKLFRLFSAYFKGKNGEQFVQTVPKLFAQTVCANCFYLGGWFFGWVSPSLVYFDSSLRGSSRPIQALIAALFRNAIMQSVAPWHVKRHRAGASTIRPTKLLRTCSQSVLHLLPKDPAVLKTLRDSELLRRSVFTTPPRFTTLRTLL